MSVDKETKRKIREILKIYTEKFKELVEEKKYFSIIILKILFHCTLFISSNILSM